MALLLLVTWMCFSFFAGVAATKVDFFSILVVFWVSEAEGSPESASNAFVATKIDIR